VSRVLFSKSMGRRLAIPLLLVSVLFGCGGSLEPVVTPRFQHSYGERMFTQEEMGKLVKMGAVTAGWLPGKEQEGRIDLKVYVREHQAFVTVIFWENGFRIEHKATSSGLKYDSEYRLIHERYNHWVRRLSRHIRKQIGDQYVKKLAASMEPAVEPSSAPAPASVDREIVEAEPEPVAEADAGTPLAD